ncbi:peptidase domain-containing ABC transporter [Aliikangiella maris]|uniref:Peptidase domain-containing ABC transporter n=2 Tax=Aliikangiella maris TaxID=3162458 RepID=A0ABV2BSA6_9GAMM
MNAFNRVTQKLKFVGSTTLSMVYQSEAAECGLACLVMVANYQGHDIDLHHLRQKYSISLKGVNLNQLIRISESLGFSTRALRLDLDELKDLNTPCILHWDLNHFVVLKSVKGHDIYIHDPACGERKYKLSEVSDRFTGIALELIKTKDFSQLKEKSNLKLSEFWTCISNLKSVLVQIFILSLVIQLFSIASPFYMQIAIDKVTINSDSQLLMILAIGFFGLLLLNVATNTLRSFILIRMGNQLNLQIGSGLFKHLTSLPIDFFEKRHLGDIVSRYASSNTIYSFLTGGVIEVILDGILMVCMLALMLIYSPKLTFIVITFLIVYGLVRLVSYNLLKQKIEDSIVKGAEESSLFMESIRGVQAIKLFGKEEQRQRFWQNKFVSALNSDIAVSRLNIWFSSINTLIFGLENILVVYFAITLNIQGLISIGMIFAFMAYKVNFTSRVGSLIEKFIEYKLLNIHINRLSDIILTQPELNESQQIKKKVKGEVELVNVGFKYSETDDFVFRNISLKIEQGESVAIVGDSGCGKTTLLKIILGLIKPTEGEIFIDGINIKKWDKKSLRKQFGTVMQEDCLFAGSIKENISFFDEKVNFRNVQIAAFKACILKDINEMPMGFESLVGEMGSTLSGGQKQRIYLARALYKKPSMLIMDEATSHLDSKNERLINKQLKNLNLTKIFIAHRSETINSANKIYCMNTKKQSVLI